MNTEPRTFVIESSTRVMVVDVKYMADIIEQTIECCKNIDQLDELQDLLLFHAIHDPEAVQVRQVVYRPSSGIRDFVLTLKMIFARK